MILFFNGVRCFQQICPIPLYDKPSWSPNGTDLVHNQHRILEMRWVCQFIIMPNLFNCPTWFSPQLRCAETYLSGIDSLDFIHNLKYYSRNRVHNFSVISSPDLIVVIPCLQPNIKLCTLRSGPNHIWSFDMLHYDQMIPSKFDMLGGWNMEPPQHANVSGSCARRVWILGESSNRHESAV